jgi:hypothetical protein
MLFDGQTGRRRYVGGEELSNGAANRWRSWRGRHRSTDQCRNTVQPSTGPQTALATALQLQLSAAKAPSRYSRRPGKEATEGAFWESLSTTQTSIYRTHGVSAGRSRYDRNKIEDSSARFPLSVRIRPPHGWASEGNLSKVAGKLRRVRGAGAEIRPTGKN